MAAHHLLIFFKLKWLLSHIIPIQAFLSVGFSSNDSSHGIFTVAIMEYLPCRMQTNERASLPSTYFYLPCEFLCYTHTAATLCIRELRHFQRTKKCSKAGFTNAWQLETGLYSLVETANVCNEFPSNAWYASGCFRSWTPMHVLSWWQSEGPCALVDTLDSRRRGFGTGIQVRLFLFLAEYTEV